MKKTKAMEDLEELLIYRKLIGKYFTSKDTNEINDFVRPFKGKTDFTKKSGLEGFNVFFGIPDEDLNSPCSEVDTDLTWRDAWEAMCYLAFFMFKSSILKECLKAESFEDDDSSIQENQ